MSSSKNFLRCKQAAGNKKKNRRKWLIKKAFTNVLLTSSLRVFAFWTLKCFLILVLALIWPSAGQDYFEFPRRPSDNFFYSDCMQRLPFMSQGHRKDIKTETQRLACMCNYIHQANVQIHHEMWTLNAREVSKHDESGCQSILNYPDGSETWSASSGGWNLI